MQPEIAKLLLERGADVTIPEKVGCAFKLGHCCVWNGGRKS